MKKDQFVPLSQNEIEIIENLTTSNPKNHTIRKYQRLYLERRRIAEKLEKALDRYYRTPDVKIYNIHYGFIWLVLFSIIFLSGLGIYFLINL